MPGYGLIVPPQNSYADVLSPVPSKVTVLGNKAFKEAIKVNLDHWGEPYSSMTGVLIKEGD